MTTYTLTEIEQYIDQNVPFNYRGDDSIEFTPFDRIGFINLLSDADNSFVQFIDREQQLICEFERVDSDTWVLSKQNYRSGR